jgi:hypothetical protein
MKKGLICTYSRVHGYVQEKGRVVVLFEGFSDPVKPNIRKAWRVNEEHEFKRWKDACRFAHKIAEELGGTGECTNDSYDNVIRSYSQEIDDRLRQLPEQYAFNS